MSRSPGLVAIDLGFPSNLEHDDVARFVRSLTIRPNDRRFGAPQPLVFELTVTAKVTGWRIRVTERHKQIVFDQLRAHLPSVRATEVDPLVEALDAVSNNDGKHVDGGARLGIELRLSSHSRLLRSDVAPELSAGLLSGLQHLHRGESVTLQWLLGPPLPRAVAKSATATELQSPQNAIERLIYPPRMDAEEARVRNRKQAEPVFGAVGRIAVAASTRARRKSLVTTVLGQLRLTSEPSAHLLSRSLWNSWTLRRLDEVRVPRYAWPCSLNADEFAALLVWPLGGPVASGVSYTGHRELPFANPLLIDRMTHEAQTKTGRAIRGTARVIGEATYPGRDALVSLSARDALQHTHVIGPTGVGKSTALANLAVQDINAGRAVVIIEPKGDLVCDVLDRVPDHRLDDVVLLDASDTDFAVGLNPLRSSVASAETTVDALVHLFKTTFAGSWGPRTQDVLHAALLTLAQRPSMTLVELPLLLTDQNFRRSFTHDLASDVALGPFWGWYESLSDGERSQVISPVLNKVRPFIMRSSVRRIIGQSRPGFDVIDVFTKRRILLVPLQRGTIGPETANLLAGTIVAQLWQATQARSSIAPEKRHPVMVYLDEFQSYLHLPTELDDVLAQARGLGVGLTLAHQHLGQLTDPAMKSGVLMNARSRIVFQAGDGGSAPLAKTLGSDLTKEDIEGLGVYEAYAKLMSAGTSTSAGSLRTLPLSDPLGSAKHAVTQSRSQFARPAGEVDDEIAERTRPKDSNQSGGGRRRTA